MRDAAAVLWKRHSYLSQTLVTVYRPGCTAPQKVVVVVVVEATAARRLLSHSATSSPRPLVC
ncbi:hypothetical protein E2C01_082956 [Portunus trituberculatus]|uniref:Uncharacterized protein n=1 Tax=Portunus trituberculatus TaxID=210409 RepID=A0A5B7J270_PORTR|nr:hypothetical protein [Portunus trituberculatus]